MEIVLADTQSDSVDYSPSLSILKQCKGTTLSFHNISYSVNVRTFPWNCPTQMEVLFDLSGYMPPGMNAIMGPTGCGKSTLLDILAGRKNPSHLRGYVLLNGKYQPPYIQRYLCGYVVQENIAMDTLTVRENLAFSATLRLPHHISSKERQTKVSNIIEELGLTPVADKILGTHLVRGVSGGERKRTCIGIELVKDPLVLYLDEPTTGLDAYTAGSVIQTLRKLANAGRTIVFSIHQPKYSIYRLFDRLTILSDGKMIYHGPAGQSAINYFQECGYFIEGHNNPADFFMDILHGEVDSVELINERKVHTNYYSESKLLTQETLRKTIRSRLIEQWLESSVWKKCEHILNELSKNFTHHFLFSSSKESVTKSINKHSKHRTQQKSGTISSMKSKIYYQKNLHMENNPMDDVDEDDIQFSLENSVQELEQFELTSNRNKSSHICHSDHQLHTRKNKRHFKKSHPTSPSVFNCFCNKITMPTTTHTVNHNYANETMNSSSICTNCLHIMINKPYASSFCHQFTTLTKRSFLNMIRGYKATLMHFVIQLVVALFLGIAYYDMDQSRESGIQNRMGLFFFTCIHLLFINNGMLEIFLKDRAIFIHETSAGFYRISTYFLSKIISDVLPTKALPASLCLSITYFLSGLRYEFSAFLIWEFTLTLLTFTASAIAFAVSAMVSDYRFGSMLISMFFVLMMITSGYLVNISTLWKWLQIVRYISILRYAMSTMAINELLGMKFCPIYMSNLNMTHAPYEHYLINSSHKANNSPLNNKYFETGIVQINTFKSVCITGEQYLDSQAIDYQSKWTIWLNDFGIFVIFCLALIVTYYHLRLIRRYK